MKGDIVLTRDVEVVEMNDLGTGMKLTKGNSWNVSTNQPPSSRQPAAWFDSFRQADRPPPKSRNGGYQPTMPPTMPMPDDRHYDLRAANAKTANTALARELKGRHLQMIAFGGSIGLGLFVASGSDLYYGGPGSLLLAYMFIGAMQYCTMQALAELCVLFPIAGAFSAHSTRFLDPSWGFAMGWNYCLQWLFTLPLEIIAGSYTIAYWNESLPKSIFIAIFLSIIIIINLFGVKMYGEAEFVFSLIKITAIIGFILLAIIINIGGRPESGYIGGIYWHNPGAFHNGFKGFCSVLITSAFAFNGTELIGLAAAETANPRKSIPTAVKQVFWRITIFYILALMLVGLLVPSDEPRLINGKSSADASASPFVIAIESAGTTILPSIMNAVILIAIISVGNSAVFGSTRTLVALAEQSQAPQIFAYIDRQGRPLVAILVACCLGLLAFLADLPAQSTLFAWLLSISSLSTLFTWISICLCHIRFRQAWSYSSNSLEQLQFRSNAGVWGSYFGCFGYSLILATQVWLAVSPLPTAGHDKDTSTASVVQNIFLNLMAIPIVLIFYLAHKIWYRTRVVRIDEMDIRTGRRYSRVHMTPEMEYEERMRWPIWKRMYHLFC